MTEQALAHNLKKKCSPVLSFSSVQYDKKILFNYFFIIVMYADIFVEEKSNESIDISKSGQTVL